MTDQACLEAWRREPGAESLRPLVERYAAFVYSSAYRRLGSAEQAGEVTHAVFLVLARRARKLRKKSVLAGWLFLVTTLACRKISGKSRRGGWRRWFGGRPKSDLPLEASLWSRVAPELDSALERLSAAQRDAVLLRVLGFVPTMIHAAWAQVLLAQGTRRHISPLWIALGGAVATALLGLVCLVALQLQWLAASWAGLAPYVLPLVLWQASACLFAACSHLPFQKGKARAFSPCRLRAGRVQSLPW